MAVRMLAIAAFLWVVSVLAILVVTGLVLAGKPDPLIGKMLTSSELTERAVPLVILALFTWTLLEIVLRAWHVRQEHLAVK